MNDNWYLNDFMNHIKLHPQHQNKYTVKHRQKCCGCGANLVNIYLYDDRWQCRKCWNLENKTYK